MASGGLGVETTAVLTSLSSPPAAPLQHSASNVTAPSRTELAIVATPDSPGVTGRTARRHRRERLKLAREAALAENKRLLDGM